MDETCVGNGRIREVGVGVGVGDGDRKLGCKPLRFALRDI